MPPPGAKIAELAAAIRRGAATPEEAVDRFVALVLSAHAPVPASNEMRKYLTELIVNDEALLERFDHLFAAVGD